MPVDYVIKEFESFCNIIALLTKQNIGQTKILNEIHDVNNSFRITFIIHAYHFLNKKLNDIINSIVKKHTKTDNLSINVLIDNIMNEKHLTQIQWSEKKLQKFFNNITIEKHYTEGPQAFIKLRNARNKVAHNNTISDELSLNDIYKQFTQANEWLDDVCKASTDPFNGR